MSAHHTHPVGGDLSGTTAELANAAQEKAAEVVDQAQAIAQDQYDHLIASIRRNPLQAAGIAAGIGFVIALAARR